MALSSLRELTDDLQRYHAAFEVAVRACDRTNILLTFVDTDFRELISGWDVAKAEHEITRTLLVGPGNGTIESEVVRVLRERTNPPDWIHSTVVEPAADMLECYKELVASESLPDVTYDWRVQTLEKYQATPSNQDAKFHFISSVHSIYYVPDLQASLRDLYDRLEPNGIMLIVLLSDNSGFGSLDELFPELQHVRPRPTSADVRAACAKQSIPISDDIGIPLRVKIKNCLADTDKLTEEGRLLLDFFSHAAYFVRDAPPELIERFRGYLRSGPWSERDGDEVYFNSHCSGIIIRGRE